MMQKKNSDCSDGIFFEIKNFLLKKSYILSKIAFIYLKKESEKIWSVDPFFPKNWARSYHYHFGASWIFLPFNYQKF